MTLENRMKQAKQLINKGVKADQDPRVREYYDRIAQAKKDADAKKSPPLKERNGAVVNGR